jgi:hypothetical protein
LVVGVGVVGGGVGFVVGFVLGLAVMVLPGFGVADFVVDGDGDGDGEGAIFEYLPSHGFQSGMMAGMAKSGM